MKIENSLDLLVDASHADRSAIGVRNLGEHDQQRDAVDAQVDSMPNAGIHWQPFDELELARLAEDVEAGPQRQRRQERHHDAASVTLRIRPSFAPSRFWK